METTRRIVYGLQVNPLALERNLRVYGPFAATERLLVALARAGADRQEMHARLREHAMHAWSKIQAGRPNLLADTVCDDPVFLAYLREYELVMCFDISLHLGDAPQRARLLAAELRRLTSDTTP